MGILGALLIFWSKGLGTFNFLVKGGQNILNHPLMIIIIIIILNNIWQDFLVIGVHAILSSFWHENVPLYK